VKVAKLCNPFTPKSSNKSAKPMYECHAFKLSKLCFCTKLYHRLTIWRKNATYNKCMRLCVTICFSKLLWLVIPRACGSPHNVHQQLVLSWLLKINEGYKLLHVRFWAAMYMNGWLFMVWCLNTRSWSLKEVNLCEIRRTDLLYFGRISYCVNQS